jgi:hypothetical protein
VSTLPAQHPAGKPPRGALTAGSLYSGSGGLDLAVMAVTGARLAWCAETDQYAAAVLARHWPDVPNLGDVTALDWAQVPPVDLVSAGWPCQDISYAGHGAGITEGTRSGLWLTIADGLRRLRPSYVSLHKDISDISADFHSANQPPSLGSDLLVAKDAVAQPGTMIAFHHVRYQLPAALPLLTPSP